MIAPGSLSVEASQVKSQLSVFTNVPFGRVFVGTDGAVVSIIIALFAARFVVGVKTIIELRVASWMVPVTDDTVRSDELSHAWTV